MEKSMRTTAAPTKTPITIHSLRPKIDVCFDNSSSMKAWLNTVIRLINSNEISPSSAISKSRPERERERMRVIFESVEFVNQSISSFRDDDD